MENTGLSIYKYLYKNETLEKKFLKVKFWLVNTRNAKKKEIYKVHFQKALNKITSEIMIPSMMNLLGFFQTLFVEILKFFFNHKIFLG